MTTANTRSARSSTTLTLTLAAALGLVLPAACADDDSSATTDGSSSSSGSDPATSTPPPVGTETAADTGTETGTAGTDTGATGTGTAADTGTASGDTADGDSTSDGTTGGAGIEIAGEWLEEFGPGMAITHVIDDLRWDQLAEFGDAIFHIGVYDNVERTVVAQGDGANEFSPGLWSRFDWTWDGDDLYYCTAVYDAETAEDALAAPASEPDDLAMGCSGFPWSPLMPVR